MNTPPQTEQQDGYQQLSNAVGPNPAPTAQSSDVANSMIATPGGILLPPQQAPVPSAALTSSGPASPTNAAPAPPSGKATVGDLFNLKYGNALTQLLGTGQIPPLNASFAAAAHALSGTPAPWANALSNQDATQPTTNVTPKPVSNGQKIVNGIEANLGDVAAATEGGTAGGGIAGAFRVAKAASTRQRQEEEHKVNMAIANSQMLHSQYLIHKLGVDELNSNIADNEKTIDTLKKQPIPIEIVGSNLTSADLQRGISAHTADPSKGYDMSTMTPYLTDKKQTGVDENGIPRYSGTYTLVKMPHEVKITDPAEAKSLVPDLSKSNLEKISESSPFVLPGATYNGIKQRIDTENAAKAVSQKAADEAAIAAGERSEKIESQKFAGSEFWTQDLATVAKQHPDWSYSEQVMGAYQMLQDNPPKNADGSKQFPRIENDIASRLGEKNFNAIQANAELSRHHREEEANKNNDELAKEQAKVESAHGEEAAGMAETYADKAADEKDPARKALYQKWSNSLSKSAAASQQFAADKKAKEVAAETQANDGDVSEIMDLVKNYQYDPDKLFSRLKGAKAKQSFIAELHRQDPNWSESNYRARFNTVQDFADPVKKGGAAVQSLQTFTGHLADANSLIQSLGNTNIKFLNTPINKLKDQLGSDKIGAFNLALKAVNHEYESFLLNQHAEHEIDKKSMDENTSQDSSPAKIQANLRQMAQTIAIRARSLNNGYRKTMGKNIPDLLDDGQKQILKTFGIDPNWITNADNKGAVIPSQTPTQQQPTGHKVGDSFTQSGHQYKVTAVDQNGNITGAE